MYIIWKQKKGHRFLRVPQIVEGTRCIYILFILTPVPLAIIILFLCSTYRHNAAHL